MAILKIARMGHPILLRKAAPVADPTAPETALLVHDMLETLEDAGGLGLAAPQVHASQRVVIFHIPGHRAEDEGESEDEAGPQPMTVMITSSVAVMPGAGPLSVTVSVIVCTPTLSGTDGQGSAPVASITRPSVQ